MISLEERSGRLTIRLAGGVVLAGVAAGAEVREGETGRPAWALARAWRREGGGARLAGTALGGRLAFALEAVDAEGGALLLRCTLENRGDAPLRVERLCPLLLLAGRGGGSLSLEGDARRCHLAEPDPLARVLRLGWSIAIPPVPLGPRDRDDASITPPLGLLLAPRPLLEMGFDPRGMPESVPGRATSAHAALLRARPLAPALAIGFTGFRRMAGRIRTALGRRGEGASWAPRRGAPGGGGPLDGAHSLEGAASEDDAAVAEAARRGALIAECDPEGRALAPGESLAAEELFLAADPRPHDALARWAGAAGRRSGARARALRYWCTWYAAPCDRIDAAFVASCAAALAARRAPLDAVVVDDGWQRGLGDWLETNAKFPRGLASIAASIREAGFRPGIWLAPFVVGPEAPVLRAHPDWVVRDARDRPRPAGWIAKIGLPRPYFALDTTREDVRAHLEATVAGIVRAGFDVLKVDFLTAAALDGRRHDPRATRAEAYALGMAAVRRGAGDAVLAGAIAPWAWNAGWVDAQRAGTDVAFGPPVWETPLARLGDWTSPSVRNALPGLLALAAMDGRLYASDGDCIVARGLHPGLARALALANLACSSATAVGDDPRRGEDDALALLERIGAFRGPRAGGGRVADLMDRTLPEEVEAADGRLITLRWGPRGAVSIRARQATSRTPSATSPPMRPSASGT